MAEVRGQWDNEAVENKLKIYRRGKEMGRRTKKNTKYSNGSRNE